MIKFRTELHPESFPFGLSYQDSLVFMGSCFAETIGSKFQKRKFNSTINPFGVIYNPISLAKALELAVSNEELTEDAIVCQNGLFHSYYHHGDLSGNTKDELRANIQTANQTMLKGIKMAKVLFITLGTAWVFKLKNENEIVANCHKVPGSQFSRELLRIDQISRALKEILSLVQKLNSEIHVVFTVSPVRHLRDGLVANNLGKAHLLASVHTVLNESSAHYFPSYELLLDDLRDYRFYDEDLSHPNQLAVNYIFGHLKETLLDKGTQQTMLNVEKVTHAYQHRVQQTESNSTKVFAKKQLEIIKTLEPLLFPSAFAKEVEHFHQLANQG